MVRIMIKINKLIKDYKLINKFFYFKWLAGTYVCNAHSPGKKEVIYRKEAVVQVYGKFFTFFLLFSLN